MFKKILIANRGEIACRVAATARRMGVRTVAVYSDADASAKHVHACDEAVRIGPAAPKDSYLRGDRILEAARATGARAGRIISVHVLGNVLGPIIVYATSLISVSMIIGSGLSFLGLGTKPPDAEWGLMLNTLRPAIYVNPAVATIPGVMIVITSICFNLFSDGLRSAMEVKS